MKVISSIQKDFEKKLQAVQQVKLFDRQIEKTAAGIISLVRREGDRALINLAAKYDGVVLSTSQLRVSASEIRRAVAQVTPSARRAMILAHTNIQQFARHSLRTNWSARNRQGGQVGEQFVPLERIGIHIPGASKPLVSTVLMTVTLAKVAGVKEIIVFTPCRTNLRLNPNILFACQLAGATEIYRVGGAQAIAAMAFGTRSIRSVDKIFGPGNSWVVAAKRLLFGYVGIDLLPGPSELLIVADDSANPVLATADLLAQAEHGSGHERIFLVSLSRRLANACARIFDQRVWDLFPKSPLHRVLTRSGTIIIVRSKDEAIRVVNRLAPEHVELLIRKPGPFLKSLRTAGAVFIGPWSPAVVGDYIAGPSHELPTGGSGRSFSGLTTDQFQRRISVVRFDRKAFGRSLAAIEQFAAMEGLPEHARSARIRLGKED